MGGCLFFAESGSSSAIVALISMFVALGGAFATWYGVEQRRLISRLTVGYQTHANAEKIVADRASVLRLHGVDLQSLRDKGVVDSDFAYILSVFNAGNAYFQLSRSAFPFGEPDDPKLDPYFEHLLNVPVTRQIYQAFREHRLLDDSDLTRLCDEYVVAKERSPDAES